MDFNSRTFTPSAKGLHTVFRHTGYNTLGSAIAELTDNGIDANSTEIGIYLNESVSGNFLDRVTIIDNGKGMDEQTFLDSVTIAKQRDDREGDIGKSGMGMKSATLNMGRIVCIATKQGSTILGMKMDFDQMHHAGTFKPTYFTTTAVDMSHEFLPEHWLLFLEQSSGTLITVNKLNDKYIDTLITVIDTLKKELSCAYAGLFQTTIHINNNPIEMYDLSYRKNPSVLDNVEETSIEIYELNRKIRVFELYKGKYHEICTRRTDAQGKEVGQYTNCFKKVSPEGTLISNLTLRTISVSAKQFEIEQPLFKGILSERKGFGFRRGIRYVGMNKKLGCAMNMELERMRMEVSFLPDDRMDEFLGMTFSKQMNDTIPSKIIQNALIAIWKRITTPWVKANKEKRKVESEESEGSDESEDRTKVLKQMNAVLIKQVKEVVASDSEDSESDTNEFIPQEPILVEQPIISQKVVEEKPDISQKVIKEQVVPDEHIKQQVVADECIEEQPVILENDLEEQSVVSDNEEQHVVSEKLIKSITSTSDLVYISTHTNYYVITAYGKGNELCTFLQEYTKHIYDEKFWLLIRALLI